MKTDNELEALLRSTLATRAVEVTEPAPFSAPIATRRHVHRVWLPILASAAAVAAVIAGVAVAVHLAKHNPPANPTPSPKPQPQVTRTVCRAALPGAWQAALQHSLVDSGSGITRMSSIAGDGSLIATRSVGTHSDAQVVQLRPNAAPQVLYTVADPHAEVYSAELDGAKLVIALLNPHVAPLGADPAAMPVDPSEILVVDVTTHEQHVLYALSGTSPTVSDGVVTFHGTAYWDEHPYNTRRDGHGILRSYDLSNRSTGTAYRGTVGAPSARAQGLTMTVDNGADDTVVVPAELPAVVANATSPYDRHYLVSDGTAYAWLVDERKLGWWAPGRSAPSYLRVPVGFYTEDGGGGVSINGRFLVGLTADQHYTLIDAVSGASATLPTHLGGTYRAELVFHRGSILAGIGFLGGPDSTQEAVLRVDTAGLPPLTC